MVLRTKLMLKDWADYAKGNSYIGDRPKPKNN